MAIDAGSRMPWLARCGGVSPSSFHGARRSRQRVRNGSAATAGLMSLTSEAAPVHRAGGGYVPCSRRCVRSGASSVSRPDTFYERGSAIGPEVSTCGAAGGARERGKPRQQASSILRAWLRQSILPVVVMFRAAVRAYEEGPAASVGLTFLTSEAAFSSRMWLRTAQQSARAKLASIDSRPHTSYERRCAGPPCRW